MIKGNLIHGLTISLAILTILFVSTGFHEKDYDFRFSEAGLKPVDIHYGGGDLKKLSAESCKECHKQEYKDWHQSRHRMAWTNEVFQDGFLVDTQTLCVHCHAPLKEQTAEVMENFTYYLARNPRLVEKYTITSDMSKKNPENFSHEGVTCVTCHYRDGQIVSSKKGMKSHDIHHVFENKGLMSCGDCHGMVYDQKPVETIIRNISDTGSRKKCVNCHLDKSGKTRPSVSHKVQVASTLSQSKFCANCHEFNVPAKRDGKVYITDVPMQSTYTEWQKFISMGGKGTCQSCHMPKGKHLFRGAHDLKYLKFSVQIKVISEGDQYVFKIQSIKVGHDHPSGDLFRHFTLEVMEAGEKNYKTIYRIGKVYHLVANESTGEIREEIKENTSIKPFETRSIPYKSTGSFRFRLRYHFSSEKDEQRSHLPKARMIRTIVWGSVEKDGSKSHVTYQSE
ncbi:MAG: hypothetical protein IEMM0008_0775 [bacterium]|nr:MAG: hypothetical protein IEMM0008_0775 [bacterium]